MTQAGSSAPRSTGSGADHAGADHAGTDRAGNGDPGSARPAGDPAGGPSEPRSELPSDGSLFGPDAQFHRFFNDPRWALAVIRATVLEAAHPQVGAALIDNSTFVAHPWRRLRNTLVSLQRMFGADDHTRQREAARLNRLHARLSGTDAQSRAYDAMDPSVRAWVVATLFESSVTMCRLSGQPLDQATMVRLYAEFRAYLAALGDRAGHLPPTLPEFWRYYDRVIEEELENTDAVRVILYKLFDHLPAPPLLDGLPTVWAAGRTVAGPVLGAITVASLPEAFRRRAGLPETPGAQTLMQSAYLAAGLARFLPEGWLRTESVTDLLYLTPGSDDPRAATLDALRGQVKRAGALFRLVAPLPAQRGHGHDDVWGGAERAAADAGGTRGGGHAPAGDRGAAREQDARGRSAAEFFTAVLDQTGDGYLDWPDLAAMARELSYRLDLDEPEETRLYNAFAAWWKELQSDLDANGDGRISAEEYAAAVPSLAGPALIRVAEVLFDVTDADGNQYIDADEYRALFRTGFRRTVAGGEARYSRAAFVKDFLSFMSGRAHSTAYDPLFTQA